jgi:branched-chain amino acid transport system ATP-binding protein
MLELREIEPGYGEHIVLRDVSLSVTTVVAVLGPNGAGKTTLLRVVSGLLRPRRGAVLFGGVDVTRQPCRSPGPGAACATSRRSAC